MPEKILARPQKNKINLSSIELCIQPVSEAFVAAASIEENTDAHYHHFYYYYWGNPERDCEFHPLLACPKTLASGNLLNIRSQYQRLCRKQLRRNNYYFTFIVQFIHRKIFNRGTPEKRWKICQCACPPVTEHHSWCLVDHADVCSDFHWNKLCVLNECTVRTVMESDICINYMTLMSLERRRRTDSGLWKHSCTADQLHGTSFKKKLKVNAGAYEIIPQRCNHSNRSIWTEMYNHNTIRWC